MGAIDAECGDGYYAQSAKEMGSRVEEPGADYSEGTLPGAAYSGRSVKEGPTWADRPPHG